MRTKSQDKWERIGLKEKQVSSLAVIDNTLIAGTDSGVFLLKRNDSTWVEQQIGLLNREIYSLVVVDNFLFASAHSIIYRTDDVGKNWIRVNDGWSEYIRAYSMLAVGKMLVVGTCCGVFLSDDYGANWIERRDGIPHNDAGFPSIRSMTQADAFILASANSSCIINGDMKCTKSGLLLSNLNSINWDFIDFNGLVPSPVAVYDGKILVGITRVGPPVDQINEVWMNESILKAH